MVDQPAINNGFPVAVGEDRFAEDFDGVWRGGCGNADLYRINVVDNIAVFAFVVILVPLFEFGLSHFPVQCVATVGLVDHNAVVLIDGGDVVVIAIE